MAGTRQTERPALFITYSHLKRHSRPHKNIKQLSAYMKPTLRGLGANILLDQGIRRLRVEAESVLQRLQIRALFEERPLQAVSTSVEVLLREKD